MTIVDPNELPEVTVPEPQIVINEVISVTAQPQVGVFQFHANITEYGVSRDVEFGYVPSDPYGFTPFFKAWLDENPNFPITPYTEPTAEDTRAAMRPITPRQLRLALVRNGTTLAAVTAALEASGDEEAQIEWEYATTFERNAPALLSIALALGMTPEAVDTLWATALSI